MSKYFPSIEHFRKSEKETDMCPTYAMQKWCLHYTSLHRYVFPEKKYAFERNKTAELICPQNVLNAM